MKSGQPLVGVLARLVDPLPFFPRAVCVTRPELSWLPDEEDGPQGRAAATACCGCPHVAPCAAWAIAHPDVPGIWGGLTTGQRHALARARRGGA